MDKIRTLLRLFLFHKIKNFLLRHACSSGDIVKTEQFEKSCSNGVCPVSQLFVFATCWGPHRSKNSDCFSTRTNGRFACCLLLGKHRFAKDASVSKSVGNKISQWGGAVR